MITKQLIESNWPLNNVEIGKVIQQKGQRAVYDIVSTEGNFVIKIVDESKNGDDLQKELTVFDFLPANGFSCVPKLLKNKVGNSFVEKDGKFFVIMEKIEGKHPEPNPKTYAKLGELTAKLHLVKNYPYKTSFIFASELPKLVENAKRYSFGEEYLKLVNSLPNFDIFSHSLIHTDIAPLNVMEKENGDIIILDWDDTGMGVTLFDLGFPLIQQFVWEDKNFFDKESAKAFYDNYFTVKKLPKEEKDQIFNAALFYALMYLPWENCDNAWKRIQLALSKKDEILSVIK